VFKFGTDGGGSATRHEIVGAKIVGEGGEFRIGAVMDGSNVLRGVTLDIDALVPATGTSPPGRSLTIADGLTIDAGHTLSIAPHNGVLRVAGSQTIGGGGQIAFAGPADGSCCGGIELTQGTILTIGPGMTILTNSGAGWLGYLYAYDTPSPGTGIVNEGTISGQSASSPMMILSTPNQFVPTFDNRGVVEAIGSGHTIVNGDWTNNGTFRIRDNGVLELGGNFSTADIGSVDRQGGTILVTGRLDNTGSVLGTNSSAGTIKVDGGTIVGGTLSSAVGQDSIFRLRNWTERPWPPILRLGHSTLRMTSNLVT
jgi:hypothetical protein